MQAKIISATELGINHNLLDENAYSVIKTLQSHNYQAYIVGGGVRDLLLKTKPKDFDIVTNATPEQVKKIFLRQAMIIGRRFKIVHIYYDKINQIRSDKLNKDFYDRHIIEVSTFRSLQTNHLEKNNHGRITTDNTYGNMNDDAFRRDFTINALYYDPIKEQVYDYHNGIQDIIDRQLKIIGKPQNRYIEDPVRIIRAIRIASKLNLQIDLNTEAPFKALKHLLINEPRGRLFEEMNKILLSGNAFHTINELKELGVSSKVFPLFTQLFFENQDEFAVNIVKRTDKRIQNGEDVSLIFIYAGIFWKTFLQQIKKFQDDFSMNIYDAYQEGFYALRHQFTTNGLSQHLINGIRDIWMMQINFDRPIAKKIDILATHRRLRQGWNLLIVRHEFNEVPHDIFEWWDNFINNQSADQTQLLIELIDKFPQPELQTHKKRRKKRKKKKKPVIKTISLDE